MSNECIFCKIVDASIPSKKVYEDDYVFAFHDIAPEAPVHVLIIPKKHIASLLDLTTEDMIYVEKIHAAAQVIAKDLGVADSGFRLVNNCGEDGGQTVHHIHYHLLGGRSLGWPPG